MLVRIVKMSFIPGKVEEFLQVFEESKEAISSFEGCRALRLLRGQDAGNILFTYSVWDGPAYLEKYRNSELFRETWARTKILFNDKPEAWSTSLLYDSQLNLIL